MPKTNPVGSCCVAQHSIPAFLPLCSTLVCSAVVCSKSCSSLRGKLCTVFQVRLAVLSSFLCTGLGPVDTWTLFPENPPWPHSPDLALVPVGSGDMVRGAATWPYAQGDALCVHIVELLADFQSGALI